MTKPSVAEVFTRCMLEYEHECEGLCHLDNRQWLRAYMEGLERPVVEPPAARSKSQLRRFDALGAKQFTCEFCGSVRDIDQVLQVNRGENA